MKKQFLLFLLLGIAHMASAQFKIYSDGKIAVNTTDTPLCPISINHAGNTDFYMSYQGPKRFLYAATNDDTSCASIILRPKASSAFSTALSGFSYPFNHTNAHANCNIC